MNALRRPVCLLLFILVAGTLAGDSLRHAPLANANIGPIPTPNPCKFIPNSTARKVCDVATDPVGPASSAIQDVTGLPSPTDLVSGAVGAAAKAVLQPLLVQFTQAEGDAVLSILKDVTKFSNTATTPNTNAEWFVKQYELTAGLGVAFALLFLIFRVGMARGDPTETGKAAVAIMVFTSLVGVAPPLIAGILNVTDDKFSPAWMDTFNSNGGATLDKVQSDFTDKLSVLGAVAAILIPLVILFVGLMAAVAFDLMIVFRYEVIFVLSGLLPVAAAFAVGGRWGGTTFSRTAYSLVGWIVMKPVIVIILTFGLLIMTQGGGIEPITLGAGILILSVVGTWRVTQVIANHSVRPPHEVIWNSSAGMAARAAARARISSRLV